MYPNVVKPILDYLTALIFSLVLFPVFFIIWILTAISTGGRSFFYQERAGKKGKPFNIIKLKTMTDARDDKGELLPNALRITKFGKFLRKFSLDELPQLINVLKGDMRLIGPRPLHTKYLPLYNAEQARRHEIKGGITGWAQVHGRNSISWETKFEYDVWYVDHISFGVDLKILWLTFLKVLKKEGVNSSENVSMPTFKGTK
jgi:lipopolysaccharide/colanic/teichoic acid biosynthesis glycosyltransferase